MILNKIINDHGLRNEATKGSKKVEIANIKGLKDFNIYIRTDE